MLALLATPVKEALTLSDTQLGLLQGLGFSIFYVFASLPLARIADRGNRVHVIAWSIAVWSLMTMCCGLTSRFWQLFVARIGVAAGEAGLPPAGLTLMADSFDRQRLPRATALFMLAPYVGGGLALLGGGALYELSANWELPQLPFIGQLQRWQAIFMLVGLPGLPLALLTAMILREPRQGARREAGAAGSLGAMWRFLAGEWRFSLSYMIGISLVVTLLNAHIAWFPSVLVRVHGIEAGAVGVMFGPLYLVAGAAGTLFAGWFGSRASSDPVGQLLRGMRIGAILLIAPAIAAPLMPTLPLALFTIGPAVFFTSAVVALSSVVFQFTAPLAVRAQVLALIGLASALIGTGLGPLVVGMASDALAGTATPLATALALVAALIVPTIAWLLHVALREHRRIRLDLRQHSANQEYI